MASSSNYREPTYTDLSHLAPVGESLAPGSMSAGNTTSRPLPAPIAGGPGSEPVNPPPPGATPDNPAIDVGGQTDYVVRPQ